MGPTDTDDAGEPGPDDRSEVRADGLRWVSASLPGDDETLAVDGWARRRTVHQLRCPLPRPEDTGTAAACRPFRPGVDDDEFLAVNHRAFEWHPEQGDLDAAGLTERLAAPWFSAEGFLLHDGPTGDLDGYCWTKVHPPAGDDPAMGEIYVIACDPSAQGRGLGRALVCAGLDHLAALGLTTGMLYVEADNAGALALYGSMGFELHHTDAAYARVVS